MVQDRLPSPSVILGQEQLEQRKKEFAAQQRRAKTELFLRGPETTKRWFVFIGVALLALFVISPAALGFLQILSEIPEWGFYAIIGIAVLIFILRRRK